METDNYPYILYKKERDHVSNILQVCIPPLHIISPDQVQSFC